MDVELMVQFDPGVSDAQRRQIIEQAGGLWKEEIEPQRIAVIQFPSESDFRALSLLLRCMKGVAHVEVNAEVRPMGGGR